MPKVKTKQPTVAEPHWREMVSSYLFFCTTKFDDVTTFSGTAPRNLKKICEELRERAEAKRISWDRGTATRALLIFLHAAWEEVNAVHSIGWFIVFAAKYRNEIIENIKQSLNGNTSNRS